MSHALRMHDVRYRYPDAARPALDGVSLDVEQGELVLVLGESGSGKSTLLRAALGLVPSFHGGELAGRVVSEGLDTREHSPAQVARHVGLVFQDPESQLVMRRADHEVAFGLENLGCDPREILPRAEQALTAVGRRPPRRARHRHALGRRAAAGGDRVGAGDGPAACCSWTSRRASSTRSPPRSCWRW